MSLKFFAGIFLGCSFTWYTNFDTIIIVAKRVFHLFHINVDYTMTKQKQPFRDVLEKRCSENMQQICRRVPMPKCDFNKVATLLKSHFGMGILL